MFIPLAAIFRDTSRGEIERSLATDILADYSADQAVLLADLVMGADDKQFQALYPKLKQHGDAGVKWLLAEIEKDLGRATGDEKERLAHCQANAAVALLRMDKPEKVWPLLKHSSDPRVRSYLIHRFRPLGVDPGVLAKRLDGESDLTIRRALVLSLGEFGDEAFPESERASLLEKLRETYRSHPDPGLHAAAEWTLRQWKQAAWIEQTEQQWSVDRKGRDERLRDIQRELFRPNGQRQPQWYVTCQGHPMVVIHGPVEFAMR